MTANTFATSQRNQFTNIIFNYQIGMCLILNYTVSMTRQMLNLQGFCICINRVHFIDKCLTWYHAGLLTVFTYIIFCILKILDSKLFRDLSCKKCLHNSTCIGSAISLKYEYLEKLNIVAEFKYIKIEYDKSM